MKGSLATRLRLALLCLLSAGAAVAAQPNILWITIEDLSPELGCYGDPYAVTPAIDRLAAEGVLYARAFSNGGACAPARSTLITGMYPPVIGTHHMRSQGRPPAFVRGFTEYLRQAGYYCSNHSKTDYNWIAPDSTWDAVDPDWRKRGWSARGDKPFFTVINLLETHSSQVYQPWVDWESRRAALDEASRHDPAKARVPPYYPDTPETREILKRYADNVTYVDREVGEILQQLEADGLADDTIVFFYSDHGTGLPRSKSFLFESSLHVPLIIRFPEKYADLAPAAPGGRVERPVAFVDFAPTVLSLAGVKAPDYFQGDAFLGERAGWPSTFVYGYRDRMDERYEFIRSIRDGRFKYIRNFFPHLPWFHDQTRLYPSTNPLLEVWQALADAGKLKGPAAIYMAPRKPAEQLFDLRDDPDELNNLAADQRYAGVLRKMSGALKKWQIANLDLGFLPEGEMWRRFDGRAYDGVRRSADAYPIKRILATADLVGRPGSTDELLERLADPDPTVRFWAATGLVALGEGHDERIREALEPRLDDQAPDTAVVAAQALCLQGECAPALAVLVKQLRQGPEFVALRAANALDQLDRKALPAADAMREIIAPDVGLEGRDYFREVPWTHWVLRAALADLER